MDNQGKPSPYGSLVHKPEHYNILMQLETSRNPDYIKDPFINKNGTAGPLQLRRTAFEDLQKHGWLKDQEYDSISGPMATAAGMKYADLIANHYGLKDPYWNALAYKEGPTLAKKLYDRHKGSIKKALQDSEMPAEGVDYLIKYSKTKLADYAKQTAVSPYIKDMYNTITRGGDINSIDPAKYQTTEVPKFKEGDEVTNPGFLSFPGMTKYTAPFAPAVGMLSNAVGFSANTKSDLFQGAGLGALSGFLSGGLPGAVLGGGASLLAYGSKMAGEENAKYEAEQAELKARTIPGREGMEMPLMYGKQGGEVVPRLLNNFIKKYSGGGFSTEGYRSNSPDVDNSMNIIPGGNISMKDVNFPVNAFPITDGQIQGPFTMTPDKEYKFSSADAVIEIPEAQMGEEIGKEIKNILLPEIEIVGKKRRKFDTALDIMGQVGSLFLGKKYDSLENKYVEEPLSGAMKVALDHALNVAMPIEAGSLKFFENAGNKLKSLLKNKNSSLIKSEVVGGNSNNEIFKNPELLKKLKNFEFKMNQPKLNNREASSVLNDFKTRIKTTEGKKRAKALGIENTDLLDNLEIYSDNNTLGNYSNDLRINLNKDLPEFRQVTRHEIEHAVQDVAERSRLEKYKKKNILQKAIDPLGWISNEGTTNIDKSLEKLELRNIPQKVDWVKRRIERGNPDPNQFYDYLSNKTNATNYFDNGSQGKEKSAMLAELQQYMVDTKKINHAYDNITPEIVKNTHVDAMFDDEKGGKFLRVLNIMKSNDNNYNLLADNLNKMLSVAPLAAAGISAKKNKKQHGGYVEGKQYVLPEYEIKRLQSLGYIIE